MEKEIVYTDKYALILSDEEIKENEWFVPISGTDLDLNVPRLANSISGYINNHCKKIIAHLPLSDAPILEGVPLLPSFRWSQQDDVNKLAYEQWKEPDYRSGNPPYIYGIGFNEGYNKAKEKYKYTEADLEIAMNWLFETKGRKGLEDLIERLNQPSRPTHFELEHDDEFDDDRFVPLIKRNSQGQVELVGKYSNQ